MLRVSSYEAGTVRADYGCEFFITPDHKSVEVRFWKDLVKNKGYIPLDGKVKGEPVISYTDPKLLKLTNARNLDGTDVNFDTLEKFEKNYGKVQFLKDYNDPSASDEYKYAFLQSAPGFYEHVKLLSGSGFTWISKYLPDHYEEKTDVDYDTVENKREYPGRLDATFRFPDGTSPDTYSYGNNIYGSDSLLFIGEKRHLNSVLEKKTISSSGAEATEVKEDNTISCPIITAFYRGRKTVYATRNNPFYFVYGNIFMYDISGEPFAGGFNLMYGGPNGLYEKFWKEYADVIRHSFHQYNLPLRLDIKDILSFRFDNIYMYDGQPLIPEKLEFEIDKHDVVNVVNAYFRTIRIYEDPPEG